MKRYWPVLLFAAVLLAGGGFYLLRTFKGPAPVSPFGLEQRVIVIDTPKGAYRLVVEVARRPDELERGLMFRSEMAPDHGMVFLFPQPSAGGFWMKNTKIPLSIAFFDRKGVILRILQMKPCTMPPERADDCPVYYPGVTYSGALEVNQGWFAAHGVREGDRIELGSWAWR